MELTGVNVDIAVMDYSIIKTTTTTKKHSHKCLQMLILFHFKTCPSYEIVSWCCAEGEKEELHIARKLATSMSELDAIAFDDIRQTTR